MDRMQEYYKNAILANLCNEYKNEWKHAMSDKRALFDMALAQQSLPHLMYFANNGMGLTKEYLESEFEEYINGKYTAIDADGVKGNYKTTLYVGYNGILSLSDDVSCFMWANIPRLKIKATKATKIYVGCKSNVTLDLQGYNSITIMLFDESQVNLLECDDTNDVTVFNYSEHSTFITDKYALAKVKTFNKTLKL